MKLSTVFITSTLLFACFHSGEPAELRNHLQIGRTYYDAAEFKKAIWQFQLAAKAEPNKASPYFWLGKSYENVGLINGPLCGGRADSKAYTFLSKAVQLAPEDREYRHELFEFLIGSDSPHAFRQAEAILQTVNASDPDYPFMLVRLHEAGD